MGLFGWRRKAAETVFWEWFVAHEPQLFELQFDAAGQTLLTAAHRQLRKVHPDLCCELGMRIVDGRREFVISAGGVKAAFPKVRSLVQQTPPLPRWVLTSFRQRQPADSLAVVETEGLRIDPAEIEFSIGQVDGELALIVYLPGFQENDARFGNVGFLFLDQALGEYDAATKIGAIEFAPKDRPARMRRYPLHELPVIFDEAVRVLGNNN